MYDTSMSHNCIVFGVYVKAKIFALAAIILLVGVVLWIANESESALLNESAQDPQEIVGLTVSAIEVVPQSASSNVTAFGVAKARWPLDVVSPVSGKISALPIDLEPGTTLKQDALLTGIVDTLFRYELSTAQARLSQAELELARYKHEQYVATQINGKQKLNAFGRFEPHVAFAQAELIAAQAQVAFSLQRLADTKIVSPFNAIVLEKYVTPSQWVNEGDVLFKLASTNYLDVSVEIPDESWQRLALNDNKVTANVRSASGKSWLATTRYINPQLNPQTRQRSIVLQVAAPFESNESLQPEQQVNVTFKGKTQHNVVFAPATVLTPDNNVWTVSNGQLLLESVEVIEEQSDRIMLRFIEAPEKQRTLVLFPLSSMLAGQKVTVTLTASGA